LPHRTLGAVAEGTSNRKRRCELDERIIGERKGARGGVPQWAAEGPGSAAPGAQRLPFVAAGSGRLPFQMASLRSRMCCDCP